MKFYILSDDADTVLGLRLAGVQGKVLGESDDVLSEIEKIYEDKEIGIIMITHNVSKRLGATLSELKKQKHPLITEIPDSSFSGKGHDNVTDYIRDAIGVKL